MNIPKINAYRPSFGAVRKSAVKHAISECEDLIDLSRLKTIVDGQKNNSLYDIVCYNPDAGSLFARYTIVPKKGVVLNENCAYYSNQRINNNEYAFLDDACRKASFLEEFDAPYNLKDTDFEKLASIILDESEED